MATRTDRAAATRPDDDNPEWTPEDHRRARPAADLLPTLIGEHAAQTLLRNKGGRPVKPDKKVSQTLRLDPDVVDAYKQQGSGWQTRMNQVLRDHMPGAKRS